MREMPAVSDADIAFGGYPEEWFLSVMEDNKKEEIPEKYVSRFSTLFFSGGRITYRNDISEEEKIKALRLLKAIMGSFKPKHEHKEIVCAHIIRFIEG